MKNIVIVLFTLLLLIGCEKKALELPADTMQWTAKMVDSINAVWKKRIPEKVSLRRGVLPESKMYPLSDTTSTPVRPTPDFTDAGVGMMISKGGMVNPGCISSCIVPMLSTWINGLSTSGPAAPLVMPGTSTPALDCQNSVFSSWNYTPSQRCMWSVTSPEVRTMFLSEVSAYGSLLVSEAYFFPCVVAGLNFGGSFCTPYLTVQRQIIRDDMNKVVEYRIILVGSPVVLVR
ncbi:MAG: hypothetical protein NTX15_07200 [Candidatus Kapabacteria bacterium]|nr:hypothetical protein [Candidatus Kapabacteria bacterium]